MRRNGGFLARAMASNGNFNINLQFLVAGISPTNNLSSATRSHHRAIVQESGLASTNGLF